MPAPLGNLSPKQRRRRPGRDFAGPNRTFPIGTQSDLDAAAHLVGKAANPEEVKKRIIAIAKRKGLKLPEAWAAEQHCGGPGGTPGPCADADKVKSLVEAHAKETGAGMRTGDLYAKLKADNPKLTPEEFRKSMLEMHGQNHVRLSGISGSLSDPQNAPHLDSMPTSVEMRGSVDPKRGMDRLHDHLRQDRANKVYGYVSPPAKHGEVADPVSILTQPPNKAFIRKHGESARLPGAEVFSIGTHKGKQYTAQDMADMEANFADFSTGDKPLFRVPAVLGHDEQDLEKSDLPAAGWAHAVWANPNGILQSDIHDVSPEVADDIEQHKYRTISSEVYDCPPEGIPGSRADLLKILEKRGRDSHADLAEAQRFAAAEMPLRKQAHAAGQLKYPPAYEDLVDEHLRGRLGKMLRRIAYLGGTPPAVKGLAQIPRPVPDLHQETAAGYRPTVLKFRDVKPGSVAGAYYVFSELTPMDRQAMLAALQECGMDTSKIPETVPDECLAEMLRAMQEPDGDEPPPDEQHQSYMDGDLPDASNDEDKARMLGIGKKYAERGAEMCAKYGGEQVSVDGRSGKPASPVPPAGSGVPPKVMPPAPEHADDPASVGGGSATPHAASLPPPMADGNNKTVTPPPHPKKTTVTHQFSEEQWAAYQAEIKTVAAETAKAAADEVRKEFKPLAGQVQKFKEDTKEHRIDEFLKAHSDKIEPRELDTGGKLPTLKQDLLRLDDSVTIHKFSEGTGAAKKTVELTALDIALQKIAARKPMKFGEKVGSGNGKPLTGGSSEADEVEKVEAHFESFAENFAKVSTTKEELVSGFKNSRKHKPNLTAEQYLNKPAAAVA